MEDASSRKVNGLYEISFSESQTTFFTWIHETTMQDLVYKHLWQQTKNSDSHEQQLGYEINIEDLLVYSKMIYVPN